MGARARLRASFACASLSTNAARVICTAMQRYGLVLSDVGTGWFLTGEATPEWESWLGPQLAAFRADIGSIKGSDMEIVVPPGATASCASNAACNVLTAIC